MKVIGIIGQALDSEEDTTVASIDVFFVDPKNGWVTIEKNEAGDQLSSIYNYRKSDAIKEGRSMSGGIFPIHVYARNGSGLQRTIYKGNL